MIRGRFGGPIASQATGTFLLQVFHIGLRFAISLGLAQMLGAAGYGAYSFATTCVGVLSVPARLGFDSFLVREVAAYRSHSQWGRLRGLLRRAYQSALAASLALVLAAAGISWALAERFEPELVLSFLIGLFLLPLFSLLGLIRATMMGFQKVVAGQVPDMLVQPVLFAALLSLAAALPIAPFTAPTVVGLSGVSALLALVSAGAILRRAWPNEIGRAEPEYYLRIWMRSAGTFITISSLNMLGTSLGVIMLGPMSGATAAGIFGIANTAAALIALPLMAINTPLAPAVSSAYSEGNKAALQRLATKAARSAFLLCLPVALIYIFFGQYVLWLFGEEFTTGYMALVILSVGQMINVATGSVGVLLQMTGHERDVALALAIAVLVNFTVNLVSIPFWGVEGAALGAAANLAVWNTILLIQVRRKLAIRPTAIG
jgi:O-antigen/teichoic acid export membrane protein